jgi:hypothetical protein
MTKRLIIMLQTQGKVGKTTWLAHATAWLRLRYPDLRLALFDPDIEKRNLSSIFGPDGTDPLHPPHAIFPINWRGERSLAELDAVTRALQSDRYDVSLLDGVANQRSDVEAWLTPSGIFEAEKYYGIRVTIVIVVDSTINSSTCAENLLKLINGRCDVILVRNEMGSNTPAAAGRTLPWDKVMADVAAHGVSVPRMATMTLPGFWGDLAQDLQGVATGGRYRHIPSIVADVRTHNGERVRAMNAWAASIAECPWLEGLSHRFDAVAEYLLPTPPPSPVPYGPDFGDSFNLAGAVSSPDGVGVAKRRK